MAAVVAANKWSGAQSPALSNTSDRFRGSDDGSSAMTQQTVLGLGVQMGGVGGVGEFNLGLGSPGLGGMPGDHGMAQLAQLRRDQHEHARHGESQRDGHIARDTAPRGWTRIWTGWRRALHCWTGLGGLAGRQGGMGGGAWRGGPGQSGGRSPGQRQERLIVIRRGNNNGAKKDEEEFDPAVLNDIATWHRSLRLRMYTPNFEGMSWKKMALMDEQALARRCCVGCEEENAQDFRGR